MNNIFDKLNINDLQRQITKVGATLKTLNKHMQQQFDYWKTLEGNLLSLIQSNEDAIKDLKSKTENFIYPNINNSSHSADFILNRRVTAINQGNVRVPSMNAHHISLID